MFELTARLDCGGFHTTRARMRGGTPLGALDIYIAPPPLEAWGAVIAACGHQGKSEGSGSPRQGWKLRVRLVGLVGCRECWQVHKLEGRLA